MPIARQRLSALTSAGLKRGEFIITAFVAVLLAVASISIVFCCYRAVLPIEIDPNEAWNAWQSKSWPKIYPSPEALTINNYPPLYFYMLHALSARGFEAVYAGRVLSILASLMLTFLVCRANLILGMSRLAAIIGAMWFLATLAGGFTGYVGMNDPHLPGLAVTAAGFVWFVARAQRGQAAEPAFLVMILAGFIKHSLIALPAAAIAWLAFDGGRKAARTTAFGLAACAAGLIICYAAYGRVFFEQLLMPRAVGLKNLHYALAYAKPLLAGMAITAAWVASDWRASLTRKIAALLAITFISGFVQALGDGLDVNAYFEFLFALAIAVGAAFNAVQPSLPASPKGAAIRFAFAALLLVGVVLPSQPEPYQLLLSREFRKDLAENVQAVGIEIKRIKKIPGEVSCTVMLMCYWAGKRFVWDDFAMKERVATGKWTDAELKRQARSHRIRFVPNDERTVW